MELVCRTRGFVEIVCSDRGKLPYLRSQQGVDLTAPSYLTRPLEKRQIMSVVSDNSLYTARQVRKNQLCQPCHVMELTLKCRRMSLTVM